MIKKCKVLSIRLSIEKTFKKLWQSRRDVSAHVRGIWLGYITCLRKNFETKSTCKIHDVQTKIIYQRLKKGPLNTYLSDKQMF